MILLIDNHDSFTFNLAHLLAEVGGVAPVVVQPEDVEREGIFHRLIDGEFDHVVIGPGPGSPLNDEDFAIAGQIIDASAELPLLGVCLGHQGLGVRHGAQLQAIVPHHGIVSQIHHCGHGIFTGLPQDFQATRYHSLCLTALGNQLIEQARAEDGAVMAIKVADRPHWGVQFHPESIMTQVGHQLVRNFLAIGGQPRVHKKHEPSIIESQKCPRTTPRWKIHHRVVDINLDEEATFSRLAGDGDGFWLDSAATRRDTGRWSVMGTTSGTASELVSYDVTTHTLTVNGRSQSGDVLNFLERRLADGLSRTDPELADVPFTGGYVGFLGYECKALTLGPNTHDSELPDAMWLRPASWIVYDHDQQRAYLMALVDRDTPNRNADLLDTLKAALVARRECDEGPVPPAVTPVEGSWRLSTTAYQNRILAIQRALALGDSYEGCLTDTWTAQCEVDGWQLYRALRRRNPAPYGAYLRFRSSNVEVCSSSPERFLTVRDGVAESKPIKGTMARCDDPVADAQRVVDLRTDAKNRAENLMIVDLVRNDLSRVCEPGTVDVPALMAIESYATVHQMVTTVRGRLRENVGLVDVLRATFPGGSMTGAPKERSVEILDDVEAGARGIYSGILGYLGFDRTADLSIVIRTLVVAGSQVSVGSGGAIVAASAPDEEWCEKNLKAAAPLAALAQAVQGRLTTTD
ncbi:aminodeoxychorismate synthase component I [Cutibacterium sp. WCA-380-WT-3A]|uniref:aminodeoxychorismate synthase n=1 Tax=Cutibacterium porci TaxID=2605781 RepID=A0A7K0J8E3_9ACTN|nr:aminodeoxychorismate synthase component I [Cutibacterium porci]MSS46210.1 aminodeoxychorismate synthase component I [Cutibacterium porci]